MLVELSLVQAISAVGRAWDSALTREDNKGPPGLAWVEISTTGASCHVVVALDEKKIGRLVATGEGDEQVYRVFAETLFSGPASRGIDPQLAACNAFAESLLEADCAVRVRKVLL